MAQEDEKWREISSFLASEREGKKQAEEALRQRREEIRQQIVAYVQPIITRDEERVEVLLPEAREKLTDVILPWWKNDLVDSGFWTEFLKWVEEQRIHRLAVGSFEVNAPWSLYAEFAEARRQRKGPFTGLAESIVTEPTRQVTTEELENRLAGENEHWSVTAILGFEVVGFGYWNKKGSLANRDRGLFLEETSINGLHRGRTHFVFEDLSRGVSLLDNFSDEGTDPRVILGFADLIESGQVWGRLQQALRK